MNNHQILGYFGKFEPERVEWLNDSSCNVKFKNDESAKNAMNVFSLSHEQDDDDEWKIGIPYNRVNTFFKYEYF